MTEIDFRHPYWGNCASVGPGWLHILLELDERMRAVAPDLRWRGIEEEFAELRARPDIRTIPSGVLDQARELVQTAQRKSAATCEECGKPGVLRKERGPLRPVREGRERLMVAAHEQGGDDVVFTRDEVLGARAAANSIRRAMERTPDTVHIILANAPNRGRAALREEEEG